MRVLRTSSAVLVVGILLRFAALLMAVGPAVTPVSLTTADTPYSENFDTLASTGTSSAMPTGWTFDESGTSAAVNGSYTAGTGSGTAGDIYSFGTAGSSDRALGELRSGTLVPILGSAFTNNTGQTITSLDIAYTGEQWRLGTAGRADRMDFQIGATATSLTSGGFVDVDALDFTSPFTTTVGALNGNLAANRASLTTTISGLSIASGATFWIRWTDVDASGSDDGLAIDDFSLTPHTSGSTGSTDPTATAAASPGSGSPGDTILLTVAVTPGTNPPSTGITVTGNLSPIGGSPAQPLTDDGLNGDATAGDNTFSYQTTIAPGTSAGTKTLAFSIADAQSRAATTSTTVSVAQSVTQIHTIQGSGPTSPLSGQVTTDGIVTGVKFNGFFIQEPDAEADSNPDTSEAVFVFTSSTPPAPAVVGNRVRVTGNVSEFKSTSTDPTGLSSTELTSPTVTLLSTGNPLPAAITLTSTVLSPSANFLTLEKYEGMRVHVDSVVSIAPTDGTVNETTQTSTSSGLFFGVLPGTPRPMREPGIQTPLPVPAEAPAGAHPPMFDGDYERIGVDTFSVFMNPTAAAVFPPPAGSTLEVTTGITVNNVTGPLDYSFRSYIIDAEDWDRPVAAAPNFTFAPVSDRADGEFTVASANMERFFDTVNDASTSDAVLTPAAYQGRLQKMSHQVRDVMKMPDIIGVEEMEHLSTLQDLADRINADAVATGDHPDYHAFLEEGNDIGGIDSGFLVRGDRVDLAPGHFTVTQYGKDTTFTEPGGGPAILNDRPPLVLEASVLDPPFEPYRITVIVNHLRSLSGVDGADGLRIRTKRRIQGEYLAQLIRSFQDQGKRVISVGDYNAFEINDGYVDVVGIAKGAPAPGNEVTQDTTLTAAQMPNPALTDLVQTAPADQRYSFMFDGIAQELDHVLVTPDLMVNRINWGRTNADFPESYRGDFTRPERVSDHDPVVAYFGTPNIDTTAPTVTVPADITLEGNAFGGATVSFTATAHDGVDGDVTPSCAPASGSVFALGTTDVTCTATDSHGNSASATFHVTVTDTTPPALLLPPDTTVEATGTGGAHFDFSVSASDIVSGTVPVTCSAMSGDLFAFGPTMVSCTAGDANGNSATGAFTVTVVDTTPPDTAIDTKPSNPIANTSATFTFHGTDSGSGVAGFQCALDGAPVAMCSSPALYAGLAQGSHTFQAAALDARGNADPTPASYTWTVDTIGPDTAIDAGPPNPTNSTSATFVFHGIPASDTAGFFCSLDGGTAVACNAGTVTYSALANGAHVFAVRGVDALGNEDATPAVFTWTIDTIAPDTVIDAAPSNPTDSTSATFTFHGTDAGVVGFQCLLDSAAFAACASPATYTGLSLGTHTFRVRAIDAAGNVDPSPATFTWTIALTPRDLKNRALQSLLPFAQASRNVAKATAAISDSLTASYWLDATHLDPRKGDLVFSNERHAVRELKAALQRDDDDDPADDGYRSERGNQLLSAAGQAAAAQAIADLVEADRLLATTAIADAQAAHVVNPRRAGDVARAIDSAQLDLADAALDTQSGFEARAIVRYRMAWDDAQDALKKAAQR